MYRSLGFDPDLDADLADPMAHYRHLWIVRDDSAVVGSVALTPPAGKITTLKRMYVRRDSRGHGWGRALLARAIDTARVEGCEQINLDTSERQREAIRLYERCGFRLRRQVGSTRYYALDLGDR